MEVLRMARGARKHRSYMAHLKDIQSQKRYGAGKGNVRCQDCQFFCMAITVKQ
jgi:hypothetical protein